MGKTDREDEDRSHGRNRADRGRRAGARGQCAGPHDPARATGRPCRTRRAPLRQSRSQGEAGRVHDYLFAVRHIARQGDSAIRLAYVPTGRISYEIRRLIRDPVDLTAALLTHCGEPQNSPAITKRSCIATRTDGEGQKSTQAQRSRWQFGSHSARFEAIASDLDYDIMRTRLRAARSTPACRTKPKRRWPSSRPQISPNTACRARPASCSMANCSKARTTGPRSAAQQRGDRRLTVLFGGRPVDREALPFPGMPHRPSLRHGTRTMPRPCASPLPPRSPWRLPPADRAPSRAAKSKATQSPPFPRPRAANGAPPR